LDDDIKCLIDALNKRLDDMHEHWMELRRTDLANQSEAIKVAYEGVSDRMKGFPQEYATQPDMKGVKEALQKLEKDAISREIYDSNYQALGDLVRKADKEKMDEKEFQQFVERYSSDLERQRQNHETAATERRAVAQGLAASTAEVATTLAAAQQRREGASEGVAATWKQMAVMLSGFGLIMGVIVVAANIAFQ